MIYNKLLSILLIFVFFSCDKEDANILESSYVIETSEGIYEKKGEYPGASATVYVPTSRIPNTNDSIIVKIISGWGERITDPLVFPKNTLFVSFINRFSDEDYAFEFESQFRNWLQTGAFPFVSDGDTQVGVGIIWFDEHSDIWISGKNIGEGGIIGDLVSFDSTVGDASSFQENSEFRITKSNIADFNDNVYDLSQEVEMQFNCTLYNSNNDSLLVRNATFKTFLHFVKIL